MKKAGRWRNNKAREKIKKPEDTFSECHFVLHKSQDE
jgi:hypothetical protein